MEISFKEGTVSGLIFGWPGHERKNSKRQLRSDNRRSRVLPKTLGLHFIAVNHRGRHTASARDLKGWTSSLFVKTFEKSMTVAIK